MNSELALDLAEEFPYPAEDIEFYLQRCPSAAPESLVRVGLEILVEQGCTDLRAVAVHIG